MELQLTPYIGWCIDPRHRESSRIVCVYLHWSDALPSCKSVLIFAPKLDRARAASTSEQMATRTLILIEQVEKRRWRVIFLQCVPYQICTPIEQVGKKSWILCSSGQIKKIVQSRTSSLASVGSPRDRHASLRFLFILNLTIWSFRTPPSQK